MSNIVTLKNTLKFNYDWTDFVNVDIDIDEYTYFQVDYRINSWHLIGHRYDKETQKWYSKELSNDMCKMEELAEFIAMANNIPDKLGITYCRVSNFTNLHYDSQFYNKLNELLDMVDKITKTLTKINTKNIFMED